jgi:hypothetical protein
LRFINASPEPKYAAQNAVRSSPAQQTLSARQGLASAEIVQIFVR